VPDTAHTTPSTSTAAAKAGAGVVTWEAPWGISTTPVMSSSTYPTFALCRWTTSRALKLFTMTGKGSPGTLSCTPLAMVTPCVLNRRETPNTWPRPPHMVRTQPTKAADGGSHVLCVLRRTNER